LIEGWVERLMSDEWEERFEVVLMGEKREGEMGLFTRERGREGRSKSRSHDVVEEGARERLPG
jgi:hypothetical protein